jgi:hypothetical protein
MAHGRNYTAIACSQLGDLIEPVSDSDIHTVKPEGSRKKTSSKSSEQRAIAGSQLCDAEFSTTALIWTSTLVDAKTSHASGEI